MKKTDSSINKMIKNFDKELKNLLVSDLKMVRVAGKALVKNLGQLDGSKLLTA